MTIIMTMLTFRDVSKFASVNPANQSFISQILRVTRTLTEKFDFFFSPLGSESQRILNSKLQNQAPLSQSSETTSK